ncbi:unnamed protein product, partial [Nesidiocoris tenuis]
MVSDKKNHRLPIARILEYPPRQQLYIELKDKLRKKVNYTIVMKFTTRLGKELEGFYISSYTTKSGEKNIRNLTKRGVPVSVYAPPDLLPQAEFALNTAIKMMDHYERFFNIAYPLPKQ